MRPTIDDIRNISDFATMYQWNLIFTTFPAGLTVKPDSDALNIRCISSDIPKLTNQPIEINIRGHKVKQAGIHNYSGTITLTFVETVDNNISTFLHDWRELMWLTKEGSQATKKNCEAGITIQRLDRNNTPIWQYDLVGCQLEDYDPTGGALSGDGNDVLKPTMTIGFDYFEDYPTEGV